MGKSYHDDTLQKLIVALCRLNPASDQWETQVLTTALDIDQRMAALVEIGDHLIPHHAIRRSRKSRRFYNQESDSQEDFFIGVRPAGWPSKEESGKGDSEEESALDLFLQQKETLEAHRAKLIRLGLALIEQVHNSGKAQEYRYVRNLVHSLGRWGLPFSAFVDILRDQYKFILSENPVELAEVYSSFVHHPGDVELVHAVTVEALHAAATPGNHSKKTDSGCLLM